MSYAFFVISLVGTAAIALRSPGRRGLWTAWFLGILTMPVWLRFEVGAERFDMRTGAAIGGLICLFAGSDKLGLRRPVIADALIVMLAIVEMISDLNVSEFGKFTIPEGIRFWVLPYFIGRIFFESANDVVGCLQPFCKVVVGISLFSMFESVTKFHVVNKLLGKTYAILESGEGYRMGLKRSQGMTDHPIYFGLVLVMLLPFAIQAAREGRAGRGPAWWRLTPWLMGGALFGTVSRGPQMAGLAGSFLAFFFGNRRWRIPILLVAVLGGTAAYSIKDQLVSILEAVGGDTSEEERYILINGEEELYSGTRHRMLLLKVYADALAHTGWFGYGNKLKGIELEEQLAERFWSIDSHYVRFVLQRGNAGLYTFVAIQLWTLFHLARLGWSNDGPSSQLAGSLFGSLFGVAFVLFSVWFTPDFGTIWIFTAGITASLVVMPREERKARIATAISVRSPSPTNSTQVTRPSLSSGCAPVRRIAIEHAKPNSLVD